MLVEQHRDALAELLAGLGRELNSPICSQLSTHVQLSGIDFAPHVEYVIRTLATENHLIRTQLTEVMAMLPIDPIAPAGPSSPLAGGVGR